MTASGHEARRRERWSSFVLLGTFAAALVLVVSWQVAERSGAPGASDGPAQPSSSVAGALPSLPPAVDVVVPDPTATAIGGEPGEVPPAEREPSGATPPPAATAAAESPAAVAPPPAAASAGMRLEIPSLGVDARVLRMGVDGAGVMQVPHSATEVAWYNFSAFPGQPGNAVMAAHVDYRGQIGVFGRLRQLDAGDVVVVHADGEARRYQVRSVYMVRPDEADLNAIIGTRSGPESITLITCGGEFDYSVRAYDHRVIVQADRIV